MFIALREPGSRRPVAGGAPGAPARRPRWDGVRRRLRFFVVWRAIFPTLGLTVFLTLSALAGAIRIGQAQPFSLPDGYVDAGPPGWITLAVAGVGVLSPVLAAFMAARRPNTLWP